MKSAMRLSPKILLIFLVFAAFNSLTKADRSLAAGDENKPRATSYAVVVKTSTAEDVRWQKVVATLKAKHDGSVFTYDRYDSLTITPNRKDSFKPVNLNGSQRGWRPIVAFLPHRIKDIQVVAGKDLKPVVTDNFILIPTPRICDPGRDYKVVFKAVQR